ncbi:MAG: lysophospholipid acyltransferase family protein [Candidatus Latescibacterota bacterium]|nr:MAG: lysophospholipid acyltransferase family protein [Candidatus Latescibacterota bacterium]
MGKTNPKPRAPAAYRMTTWAVSKLSQRMLTATAQVSGLTHYLMASGKRRDYRSNLSPVVEFGPGCRPWRAFQNQILNVLELLKVPSQTDEDILNRMTLHGGSYIDATLGRGNGLILATFHSGNWELSGLMLSLAGYPITTVAGEQLRAGWSDEVKSLKERFGIKMAGETSGLRELYRDLEANRALVLHIDGDVFTGGIVVRFLGRTLAVPRGPAHLSRVRSAPVALAYCRRAPDDHLDVHIEPPMPPPVDADGERTLTQSLMSRIEKLVVEDPGQWCIFRDLFGGKARPLV